MAKKCKVVTINSGLLTGTVKAAKLQEAIDKMSAEGWDFKNCQDVIGRRCGCMPYQIIWAIFEKEA
jgi:hypothetical protein